MVRTGIRWAHHATVQHAGHTHVVHEDELAHRLGRDVDARRGSADHTVVFRRLDRRVVVEVKHRVLRPDQLAIADARASAFHGIRRTARPGPVDRSGFQPHPSLARFQCVDAALQTFGGLRHQPSTRLRRGQPQGYGVNLQRGTGDGGALIRSERGVAQHHVDCREVDVEFFGNDLRQRGADARAQVDVAVEGRHAAVAPHGDQYLDTFRRIAGDQHRLAPGGRRWRRRIAHDQQHTLGRVEVGTRTGRIGATLRHAHRADPASVAARQAARAARKAALTISTCVPQRHKLPDSSRRMAFSSASGWRASRAATIMIMPFRQ